MEKGGGKGESSEKRMEGGSEQGSRCLKWPWADEEAGNGRLS